MKKISSAFENFAFKAFDFSGRATLLEYWMVMPLLWVFIIFLAHGDIMEIWATLLERKVPSLNPLYWDSLVVFALTMIPRFSLTVRRLHDSGKRGRWATLPVTALFYGFMLILGLMSALATSSVVGNEQAFSGMMAFGAIFAAGIAIILGTSESAWTGAFDLVAAANAMGWDVIIAFLAELTAPAQHINLSEGLSNIATDNQRDPSGIIGGLSILMVFVALPFVAAFLHVFFMISPTKPDHDLESALPISGASLRKIGKTSGNPFEGYKYLTSKTPAQVAADKIAAKEEIKSLYRQRVLGSQLPT